MKSGDVISSNNNRGAVRTLARCSIKASRMRNIFVVLTIILSVSLLVVISLFYAGIKTEEKRHVAGMQHSIYMNVDEEQLAAMAEDERSTYVLGIKDGQLVEINGNMVRPTAYENEPRKDKDTGLETLTLTKGSRPQELYEVVVSDAYCKLAGVNAEPGEKISFTWLDGTTEDYTISGIYHVPDHQPLYSVVFSEEYARTGSQLKDVPWQAVVCLEGADDMTQSEFENAVYSFGADFGLERRDMNINNFFLNALPGGDQDTQEAFLIVGAGIGFLFISVLVIYSVFYLAIVGRIRQFGQLRTLGMTKKQIRRMVRIEGLTLCAAGIPIGLLLGGAVSYFIRPGGWSWLNMLAVSAAVTAADIVTVLISVRKPAKIAASVSPVEAAKYSGYGQPENINRRFSRKKSATKGTASKNRGGNAAASGQIKAARQPHQPARRITPGSLARMSNARNRKKSFLTMASLGIGGVLYMLAAFMTTSTSLEGYARQGELAFGEFYITYSYNVAESAEHGQNQLQAEYPLDEDLIRRIKEIDGVEEVLSSRKLMMGWEAKDTIGIEQVSPLGKEKAEAIKDMRHEGDFSYDELVENDGILFMQRGVWKEVFGWTFEIGDEVKLQWYDGQQEQEKTFRIMGLVNTDDFITEPSDLFIAFSIPEETMAEMAGDTSLTDELVIKTDRTDDSRVEDALNDLLADYPWLSMGTLRENMLEAENQFVTLYSVMIGLSIFIIGFALINLLNTLITNILTRDHEFAMLQSVGMTRAQLAKMLRIEGVMLAGGNLAITLTAGTAAGWILIEILRHFGADYMHFTFPIWFFLAYAVFIILVPVLVTEYMVRRFQKQTLVERLRV